MQHGARYPHYGWCWRCAAEVPLLTDSQHGRLHELYSAAVHGIKEYRGTEGVDIGEVPVDRFMTAFFEAQRELTGFGGLQSGGDKVAYASHLLTHRADYFGPPCGACGKLLRSPRAQFCAECGAAREGKP